MPRFFADCAEGNEVVIAGEDARHIAGVLRMRPGESLTVCDGKGIDCACVIQSVGREEVRLKTLSRSRSLGEPETEITVYQGLPKGDKMDWIVQKCVELGAGKIVPVQTGRSVSRPDPKTADRKAERWRKIAAEAAKQCGRGKLPEVSGLLPFRGAAEEFGEYDLPLLFYEGGGERISSLLTGRPKRIAVFIGPEGGFEPEEVALLREKGAKTATLGPRILRTETAPIAAVGILMYALGEI